MSETQPSLVPKYLQVDLTQECKELIHTLPKVKGWIGNHLHQYEGFWYPTRSLQGLLTCQKHFQALDADILLVTIPKSGTTWLKALAFALLNRKRYEDMHIHDHPLLTTNPHDLVPFLELNIYVEKDRIPDLNLLSSPRLFATHLPYVSLPKSVKESNCKIVYLCRDPKDTFVSMWHFANKLRPESIGANSLEECFDTFCRGMNPYGPYWDHILGYWKESLERPEKIMFLKFEDMKIEPTIVLKKLAEFVGCSFSKEEEYKGIVDGILNLCSFDNLSNLQVNKTGKLRFGVENKVYFRRGEVGDSKNLLTVEMNEMINTIVEKKLGEHGLRF
ncbi:hypothetical protein RIF29_16816 [Crotalaria pallida]|uniref:Sulfotransferase n=1 Tax=Crotalaria pallida TaxID=3830 RepID=A0AAN9IET2_CROPI